MKICKELLFKPCEIRGLVTEKHRLYIIGKSDFKSNSVKVWNATKLLIVNGVSNNSLINVTKFDQEIVEKDKAIYISYDTKELVENNRANYSKNAIYDSIADSEYILRQTIVKFYPWLLKEFDDKYRLEDTRDVVEGIERFLKHVFSRIDYNRKTHIVKSAYSYLRKYGYTELPGFEEAWLMLTNLHKLPGEKALNKKNKLT